MRRFLDHAPETDITLGAVGDWEELRSSLVLEVGDPSDPRHRQSFARRRLERKQHAQADAAGQGLEAPWKASALKAVPRSLPPRIMRLMCVAIHRHVKRQITPATEPMIGSCNETEIKA